MEAKELLERIDAHDEPLVVDARTSIEYKHGHVPGAVSAPLGKILVRRVHLPKERMVVTCHGGERAWIARKILAHRGYRETEPLTGHMRNWKKAGLPMEPTGGS